MKRNILVLALLLTLGMSSTFANNAEGVSDRIINSFKKDFTNAQDVQWEKTKEFVKVTFSMNDQVMYAYYGNTGSLIAVTRNILSGQLPINLLADIKRNYGSYWISDLFEISMNNETAYYITLESGDQTLILKSAGASGWDIHKKEKKSI
jgi:hypothetical protein